MSRPPPAGLLIPSQVEVVVVGLGLVGAALAILLGTFGVRTLVVERSSAAAPAPGPVCLDHEALRVLQLCGVGEGDFDVQPISEVRWRSGSRWLRGRTPMRPPADGHPRRVTFHPPQLLAVLRARLAECDSVTVAEGFELVSAVQNANAVFPVVRDAEGFAHYVRCRCIVGADGADSAVRRFFDLGFPGFSYAEPWLVVDARRQGDAPDYVEFSGDPSRPGPHLGGPGGRERWEFRMQARDTDRAGVDPAAVRRLLRPWDPEGGLEIEQATVRRVQARLAESFQRGRAFLVGDAAHLVPPFLGQGLAEGLRDAANLAWKLAWVLTRGADPGVLLSYTQERRPRAMATITLSHMTGRVVAPRGTISGRVVQGAVRCAGRWPKLRRWLDDLEVRSSRDFSRGLFVAGHGGAGLRRGGALPQTWVRAAGSSAVGLSDGLLGGLCAVGFGVDPAEGLAPEDVRRWVAAGGRFVRVDPRGGAGGAEDLVGDLVPARVPGGWVAIVRPDRIVMEDGPRARAAAMMEACLRLLGLHRMPAQAGAPAPRDAPDPPVGVEGALAH